MTISMNTVLNFLHSMALSTSNKQWLADHLYEEVKAERLRVLSGESVPEGRAGEQNSGMQKAAATTNNGWPKIRREDMRISPEVANLVKGFELPEDADYDQLKLEYLMKKYG
ncbi:MAG: hypothetical protein IJV34_07140 [Prevotella sp.]|nr:hypothetical protein [Prevotella sp.]